MGDDSAAFIPSLLLPHFDLLAARHHDCELSAWCAFYRSDYSSCLRCLRRCEQAHSDPPTPIPRYFNDLHSTCSCYLTPATTSDALSQCWALLAGAQRLALISAVSRPPFLERVEVDASFLLRHTLQTLLVHAFVDAALALLLSLPSPSLCGSELPARVAERWLADLWVRGESDGSGASREGEWMEATRLLLQRQLIDAATLRAFCLRSIPCVFTLEPVLSTLRLCDAWLAQGSSTDSLSLNPSTVSLAQNPSMDTITQSTLSRITQENTLTLTQLTLSPYHHHSHSFEGLSLPFSLLPLLHPTTALFRQCALACFLQAWLDRNDALLITALRLLHDDPNTTLPSVEQIVAAEPIRVVTVRASSPTEEALFTHLFHRLALRTLRLFTQAFTTATDASTCPQQQCTLLQRWQEELQDAVDRSAEALRSLDAGVLRLLLGAVKEGGIDPFVAPVMELWQYVSGEAIVEACVASIEVTKEVEECELRENGVVWRKSGVLLRIEKNRDNGLTVQWKGDGWCVRFILDAPMHPSFLDSSSGQQEKVDCLCANPSVLGAFVCRSSREGVRLLHLHLVKDALQERVAKAKENEA